MLRAWDGLGGGTERSLGTIAAEFSGLSRRAEKRTRHPNQSIPN